MQIISTASQIKKLITGAQKILLITHKNPNPDGISAMLGIKEALSTFEKNPTLLAENFEKEKFLFLQDSIEIKNKLPPKSLTLVVDYKDTPVSKINYETRDDKLFLTFTPFSGNFDPERINYSFSNLNYNLSFVLDTPEFELLGEIANEHQEDLKKIPLINIDFHPQNSLFGKINYTDPNASSTCEVVVSFLENLGVKISENIARHLLLGILFRTCNLQKNLTPSSLKTTAKLIEAGADKEEISAQLSRFKASKPSLALQDKISESKGSDSPTLNLKATLLDSKLAESKSKESKEQKKSSAPKPWVVKETNNEGLIR